HLLLGRALADDRAVLRAPELRVAVPALQRRAVEDGVEARVLVEHERIGAARHAPAASAAAALRIGRRLLRGQRDGEGGDDQRGDVLHTVACCVTATCSQRPLFADFRTASVTASVARPSRNVGAALSPRAAAWRKSAN